jgi:hypothetical protein
MLAFVKLLFARSDSVTHKHIPFDGELCVAHGILVMVDSRCTAKHW